MLPFAGVTAMLKSVALFTVSVVLPLTPPEEASIVVVPALIEVAKPWVGV